MRHLSIAALVLLHVLLLGRLGLAQSEVVVDADKIVLADIVPGVDDELASIEIATAPPPGGSRLVNRNEVERVLSRAGVAPKRVSLPAAVRIRGAVMRKTEAEVEAWLKPAVEAALPSGVTLTKLSASQPLLTSPSATPGRVTLPRFPRRAGAHRSTVVAELDRGGVVLQRITLSFVAELADQAARPDIERGAQISLVVETAGATLTAMAAAMESGNIGEIRMFRVVRTGRVLRARIETQRSARVVAP